MTNFYVRGMVIISDRVVGARNFSFLPGDKTATRRPTGAAPKMIGFDIRSFKIDVKKGFRVNSVTPAVWQRDKHEHIIRNEDALNR